MRVECGINEADLAGLRATAPATASLVEGVLDHDRSVAVDALFFLKNDICHQGMAVSPATPTVLPILITLLSCRELPVRVEVFTLVRRVAQAKAAYRRAARDAGSDYAHNYREKIGWEVAVDRVFAESRPQLEALRNDPDAVIRELADEVAASIR